MTKYLFPPLNPPDPPPADPPGDPPPTTKPDPPPAASDSDTDTDASFDNLEVIDASLKGKLAVLRVGSEPTSNNLLSVFAGLKNKTGHRLDLEVQTLYKDRAGNPLNGGGTWLPLSLKPHEETEYRSASISADAFDFLISIRAAHGPQDPD